MKKNAVISTRCKTCCPLFVIYAAIAAFLISYTVPAAASNTRRISNTGAIIVIDPGHGGHDKGVRSPSNILEKDITLTIARHLKTELTPQYKVFLTRTDDYQLDSASRTSHANHRNADIFISLHAGGGFRHQTDGFKVFYHKSANHDPDSATSRKDQWTQIQKRHQTNSQTLAELIAREIKGRFNPADVRVKGAPLFVLEGADMPAVLVECGYLTNPTRAEAMHQKKFSRTLAGSIKAALDAFWTEPPK